MDGWVEIRWIYGCVIIYDHRRTDSWKKVLCNEDMGECMKE